MTRTVNTAHDLDEDTLRKIAKITGGQYFRAKDQKDLEAIYDQIDKLEPISQAKEFWRPQSEWFVYPLGIALLLSAFLVILRR